MRRRLRRWMAVVALLGCAGVLSICFAPLPTRDRLYREVSYQFLADRVTAGARTDLERVLRLFHFIHLQMNVVGVTVVDETTWNDLVRGIGWCDQQSWGLATLLAKEGIHARFAMLRKADGVSPHTIAEVYLDDRWALFDPLNGLYYQKPDGTFATLEEVADDPTLVAAQPLIQQLKPEVREAFLADPHKDPHKGVSGLYPVEQEPTRWSSLLTKKNRSPGLRLANAAIRWSVRTFGAPLVHGYQDFYFLTERRGDRDPAEVLYRRARNYHLYARLGRAERMYRTLIEQFPQHGRRENAQFYLGVLLNESGEFTDSLAQLDGLLAQFPGTQWQTIAQYYIGRNYEASGDIPRAIASYEQGADTLDLDGAWRVARLAQPSAQASRKP